ncbi:mitotic spindle-associated MMXD complex subunit MIP18, putative (macronuclear) [Tetrahymena thermophila SB210]|uniref:Mitotic spindle-associated MMXD complex subunit MIP18, putative n=1 Tax=Tetrahymena thermophila (strain SB210) TaxID=312017 RepID=I7M608_TETTS|nr:mitotic spindle-associated MMXD complex subunit MIP18, putative [Tetrahymena thermophila SB210]EAR83987.2 mitotic spindle-associated MMXD complex subunit MIP18, putative [Tetrahymena thermophila SB210]|eukprot:XP_001031650.2 mitotic spindle-associated MMXD complex subunit MIP18, putative [Tetrahymena thermophila SB210]
MLYMYVFLQNKGLKFKRLDQIGVCIYHLFYNFYAFFNSIFLIERIFIIYLKSLLIKIARKILRQQAIMSKVDNPNPQIHEIKQTISEAQRKKRDLLEQNEEIEDEIDQLEIFDLIRHIDDPEHPLTLEQLNVLQPENIKVNIDHKLVTVLFTPTIPHCSLAQIIGLMIKVKLIRSLPRDYKVDVYITPGTHVQELSVNKQINDKERVMAAIENPSILRVVNKGVSNSDRLDNCC